LDADGSGGADDEDEDEESEEGDGAFRLAQTRQSCTASQRSHDASRILVSAAAGVERSRLLRM
jgi:hypothetical protein